MKAKNSPQEKNRRKDTTVYKPYAGLSKLTRWTKDNNIWSEGTGVCFACSQDFLPPDCDDFVFVHRYGFVTFENEDDALRILHDVSKTGYLTASGFTEDACSGIIYIPLFLVKANGVTFKDKRLCIGHAFRKQCNTRQRQSESRGSRTNSSSSPWPQGGSVSPFCLITVVFLRLLLWLSMLR